MSGLRLVIFAGILAVPRVALTQTSAGDSVRATRAGVYTAAQAARGRSIYQLNCASCHTLASHTGPLFTGKWNARLLWDLFSYVSASMPKYDPGSLAPEEYAGVVAYLLKVNDMPAGASELPADSTALKKIRIELAPKRDSTPER